jgi:ATP-dependent Clp protease ATP-binding subunit ClpC
VGSARSGRRERDGHGRQRTDHFENRAAHSGSLMGMFEHFTDGARRILVLAQQEAEDLHDGTISPDHLLLGMLREGEGVASKALSETGVGYDRARALIAGREVRDTAREAGPKALSKGTMRIVERSLEISWVRADGWIETEHLLVALLEQGDEATEAVLADLDVTPEEVTQRLDQLLAERALQFGHRRAPPKGRFRD